MNPKMERAIAKQKAQLADAIEKLRTSEGWQRWLKTRSRFHRYSITNTLLIASQFPEATLVRGYRQWRDDFNRQVRHKQKAIWIRAPRTKIINKGQPDEEKKTYFKSVKVFDVSQTDQIPGLPEIPLSVPPAPIEGSSHADWISPLTEYGVSRGLRVEFWPRSAIGRPDAFYRPSEQLIAVSTDQSDNQIVARLVHELAHAHGIDYETYDRETAETMAEAAAYIACGAIGLDTSAASVPYITGWDEAAEATLRSACTTIDNIASAIIDCRNSDGPEPTTELEAATAVDRQVD